MQQEFNEFLALQGYEGFIGMKIDGVMGCAIYWRTEEIEAVRPVEKRLFENSN